MLRFSILVINYKWHLLHGHLTSGKISTGRGEITTSVKSATPKKSFDISTSFYVLQSNTLLLFFYRRTLIWRSCVGCWCASLEF